MKRIVLAITAVIGVVSMSAASAALYGVVDMQQVFHSSSKIQKINSDLNSEFSSRKQAIVKKGQALQDNMAKYKKTSLVAKPDQLDSLKKKITKQELDLRHAQAEFQKDLYAEQSKKMASFMAKMKSVIQDIATDKHLDLVLPKNAVLYSKGDLDITKAVLNKLD